MLGGLTEQHLLDKAATIDDNPDMGLTKPLEATGTSLNRLFPETDP